MPSASCWRAGRAARPDHRQLLRRQPGGVAALAAAGRHQCNIAHALEKTKYLFSDLYWRDNEEQLPLLRQFTADLIAMNTADFIITSTYQEIAGHRQTASASTRATWLHHAGAVSRGGRRRCLRPASSTSSRRARTRRSTFPYTDTDARLTIWPARSRSWSSAARRGRVRGARQPGPAALFTMARWTGSRTSPAWWTGSAAREPCGTGPTCWWWGISVDPGPLRRRRGTRADRADARAVRRAPRSRMGRCAGSSMSPEKTLAGELYRRLPIYARAFVQPALFEAFGLTVIEAMSCGPADLRHLLRRPAGDHRGRGLRLPHRPQSRRCRASGHGGVLRVRGADDARRTGSRSLRGGVAASRSALHVEALRRPHDDRLARIYGFWKYITDIERHETRRYLEMLYAGADLQRPGPERRARRRPAGRARVRRALPLRLRLAGPPRPDRRVAPGRGPRRRPPVDRGAGHVRREALLPWGRSTAGSRSTRAGAGSRRRACGSRGGPGPSTSSSARWPRWRPATRTGRSWT
jgi:sucrose synthase